MAALQHVYIRHRFVFAGKVIVLSSIFGLEGLTSSVFTELANTMKPTVWLPTADVIRNVTILRRWPSIETILDQCHLFTGLFEDVIDSDNVCVIGQGKLSRPMIYPRSISVALRMFFTTIVAKASDAIKTKGYIFKGNIYYCNILHWYHRIFALESRTSASFPQVSNSHCGNFVRLYWSSLISR